MEILNMQDYKIVAEFSGNELENIKYKHPIYDIESPIILADYVSNENGTGLVHNAPDFGAEDYLACKKYDIKPIGPLDNYGKFNDNCIDKELVGIFYDEANKIICDKLTAANALLKLEFFTHSVAHD
jgi:isoleucyl-tRNA synthetase